MIGWGATDEAVNSSASLIALNWGGTVATTRETSKVCLFPAHGLGVEQVTAIVALYGVVEAARAEAALVRETTNAPGVAPLAGVTASHGAPGGVTATVQVSTCATSLDCTSTT